MLGNMQEETKAGTRRDADLFLDDSLMEETEETISFLQSLSSTQKLAFKSFMDGIRFSEGLRKYD